MDATKTAQDANVEVYDTVGGNPRSVTLDVAFTIFNVLQPYTHEIGEGPLALIGAIRNTNPRVIISLMVLYLGMSREEAFIKLNLEEDATTFLLKMVSEQQFRDLIRLGYTIGALKNG